MPRSARLRTRPTTRRVVIPEPLVAGVQLLSIFRDRGLIARIDELLPLSRRGGHRAGALFSLFVSLLMAGRHWRIATFDKAFRPVLDIGVAMVSGHHTLPSPAATSRALGDLAHPEVRACVDALLREDVRTERLLTNPAVHHHDAHGRGWHVLDFDPSVEAFRQRGLPSSSDLPEPKRVAVGTAGYTGHKRGEIRVRHVPLRHAGAGLWLGYRLEEGSGTVLGHLGDLLGSARARLSPLTDGERIVLRADGEFGSVGALRTCRDAGVDVITRLSRYSLLKDPVVMSRLAQARWRAVPDSGSGPTREATDLGIVTLLPSEDAENAELGPVDVRVVVTRLPRVGKPDHGVLQDGFQIELFATTLAPDAWPAEDAVALFYGRGGAIENAFAQEDREFGIDRTFSYHPPGQEWVAAIALFLWNTLILQEIEASPLPEWRPTPVLRPPEPMEPPPLVATLPVQTPPEAPRTIATPSAESSKAEARETLWAIVRASFMDLSDHDGWRLDEAEQAVLCPRGVPLVPKAIERPPAQDAAARLYLQAPRGRCGECPVRADCIRSTDPEARKRINRAIPPEQVSTASESLATLRRPDLRARRAQVRPTTTEAPGVAVRGLDVAPGPCMTASPLFLVARARSRARDRLNRHRLELYLKPALLPKSSRHPLLADSAADRQHRRMTWTERRDRRKPGGEAVLLLHPVQNRHHRR